MQKYLAFVISLCIGAALSQTCGYGEIQCGDSNCCNISALRCLENGTCAEYPNTQNSPCYPVFVDLFQYTGTWYEIASLPAPFEANCIGAKVKYSLILSLMFSG